MQETQCSTMHCRNRAVVRLIPFNRCWWLLVPDPAPFCDACRAAKAARSAVLGR